MKPNAPVVSGSERIEIVTDAARLAAIGPAWGDLWARGGAPIFQHHDWIEAWWNATHAQADRKLLIVLAWRDDTLLAVLPLATNRHRGLTVLEWAGRDACDYCDALLLPGTQPAVLFRLWERLCAEAYFDVSLLNRLLPGASAWGLLKPGLRGVRLSPNRRIEHSMRVAGDWNSGEEWFSHFPKKIRQNYKRGVKFLEEGAELRFRLLEPHEDVGSALAQLAAFKRLWLQKTGIRAPLFDEDAPMLPALARVLVETGRMRMFVLERQGEIIAISLNFVEGNSLRAFVTAYDPAFERGSPGMVLMMDYIRWAFDNGLREVDFLTGAEDFKNRFATRAVPLASIAGAGSLLGHAAMLADGATEKLRDLLRRSRSEPEAPPQLVQ